MRRVYHIVLWAVLTGSVLLNLYLGCDCIATYGERADKTVVDTLVVHDTVRVIDPTVVYERVFRVDTVWMGRADRETENPPKSAGMDSAHLIYKVSKSELKEDADTVGKLRASYGQVSDSVPVLVPITQRVYKDSTCTVWVSGYNPTVDSVHVYRSVAYYPVVSDKEYDPPNIVVSIGPYMGFGNKGFNYGIALTVGVPIELKWPW